MCERERGGGGERWGQRERRRGGESISVCFPYCSHVAGLWLQWSTTQPAVVKTYVGVMVKVNISRPRPCKTAYLAKLTSIKQIQGLVRHAERVICCVGSSHIMYNLEVECICSSLIYKIIKLLANFMFSVVVKSNEFGLYIFKHDDFIWNVILAFRKTEKPMIASNMGTTSQNRVSALFRNVVPGVVLWDCFVVVNGVCDK